MPVLLFEKSSVPPITPTRMNVVKTNFALKDIHVSRMGVIIYVKWELTPEWALELVVKTWVISQI
jgi:hypothetical protein